MADYSASSPEVDVVFRNIEDRLLTEIGQAKMVVGCVAWMTSLPVLNALRGRQTQIIVQKEDFLRPDIAKVRQKSWSQQLRNAYDNLKFDIERYEINKLSYMSVCSDPSIAPVRCVGNHNSDKLAAFPRMHNKFLVFCEYKGYCDSQNISRITIHPYAVWTGSFNMTKNSTYSFENAVIIRNKEIALAYFNEWQQIASISEPVDWTSDWIAPEWRIGS